MPPSWKCRGVWGAQSPQQAPIQYVNVYIYIYKFIYCREWGFVAGFHDFSDFIMRELCGIIFPTVFTPNRERILGLCFGQPYRTFENYDAGCR